jgi:hypothetical protein
MRFQKKTIIYESKIKYIILAIISLLFVIGGIWTRYFWGYTFFGFCFLTFVYMLFNKRKYVFSGTVDYDKYLEDYENTKRGDIGIFTYFEDGFDIKLNIKKRRFKWEDIETIVGYEEFDYEEPILFLDVFCKNGFTFIIYEETRGWYVFTQKLEEEFKKSNAEFAIPVFVEEMTLIFDKENRNLNQIKEKYYNR